MIVMKFGGSSVGNAAAIGQVASIVENARAARPVIVVSALQGITDQLIAMARAAAKGDLEDADRSLVAVGERHRGVVRELLGDGCRACLDVVDGLLAELGAALRGVVSQRELSPRSHDLIVSFGERLSAPIVAAAIAARGLPAETADARTFIVTDDRFTGASVLFDRTDERLRDRLAPVVARGVVPVVTGFIGATEDGETTTLGRGGSDYSVSIVAGGLGAEEIWIWKEVDGVMTADPGVVPDAALLPAISYDEAAEMSYFGAKVLHPKTMIPAVQHGIPIRMRNTFRPEAPGTVIGPSATPSASGVKVVTAIKKLAMVTVEGKGMMGIAGFAGQVFAVAGRLRVNIVMFMQSSSEQCICLLVGAADGPAFKDALERELGEQLRSRTVDRIIVDAGVAAVAVVGEGMRGVPGVAATLFGAVAAHGVNVLAIAQGSSELNISFVVREEDADRAVRAAHRAFGLHALRNAALAAAEA